MHRNSPKTAVTGSVMTRKRSIALFWSIFSSRAPKPANDALALLAAARHPSTPRCQFWVALASLVLVWAFGVSAARARCFDPEDDKATSGSPSKITFENRTRETLQIRWIDYGGKTQIYSTLRPGQTFAASTFVTHKWIATTLDGACVGTVFSSDGDRLFRLTMSTTTVASESDNRQRLVDECYRRGQTYQLSMIDRCGGDNYCIGRSDAPAANYIGQCVEQVQRGGDPTRPPSLGSVQTRIEQPPGPLEDAPPVYSNSSQRSQGYNGF